MCHPFAGPRDLRHDRVADRIAELANKNTEYYGINSYFKVLFFGRKGIYNALNHLCGRLRGQQK